MTYYNILIWKCVSNSWCCRSNNYHINNYDCDYNNFCFVICECGFLCLLYGFVSILLSSIFFLLDNIKKNKHHKSICRHFFFNFPFKEKGKYLVTRNSLKNNANIWKRNFQSRKFTSIIRERRGGGACAFEYLCVCTSESLRACVCLSVFMCLCISFLII